MNKTQPAIIVAFGYGVLVLFAGHIFGEITAIASGTALVTYLICKYI